MAHARERLIRSLMGPPACYSAPEAREIVDSLLPELGRILAEGVRPVGGRRGIRP